MVSKGICALRLTFEAFWCTVLPSFPFTCSYLSLLQSGKSPRGAGTDTRKFPLLDSYCIYLFI